MYVDNPFQSPVVLSFCPGILGIERGLARAGVKCRVAAYVEIEAFIIANLVAGMEAGLLDPAPVWTDANTFDARQFRGRIHGIIGGYPCPGESLAGLREGHLYKGFLWPAIRKAIAAARPLWCFFENVDDHLTGTYPVVQRSLRNMGYAVEAGIYTAEEVGAPHERKRLFILAIMGNAASEHAQGFVTRQKSFKSGRAGQQMEHAISSRLQERRTAASQYTGFALTGKELSDTNSKRGFIPAQWELSAEQQPFFPAPQGCTQYEWEEPRTIEPGMGCTIDGYNFREDLLRAYGNSVVEQTAELAFIDLMNKFLKPIS